MMKNIEGIIVSGVGGLYSVRTEDGAVYPCRAKGAFRKRGLTPLAGDHVSVRPPEVNGEEYFIEEIFERKNSLIRPPMANLETLFVTFAPKNPEPSTLYLDKLLSIAVHNRIHPVVVITKVDLSSDLAEKYAEIYRKAGFPVFISSSEEGKGIDALSEYIRSLHGVCAFAGASGVGKSTLMNALFPTLSLDTGVLSEKISRGKHTTRSVTLYPMSELLDTDQSDAYVADTPGFSMLDFIEFDFYSVRICRTVSLNLKNISAIAAIRIVLIRRNPLPIAPSLPRSNAVRLRRSATKAIFPFTEIWSASAPGKRNKKEKAYDFSERICGME